MVMNNGWMRMITILGWYATEAYTYGNYYYKKYLLLLLETISKEEGAVMHYPFSLIDDDRTSLTEIHYHNVTPCSFKFIQTLVEVKGVKHEVNIDRYMVVGNRLFDEGFVEWLLLDQQEVKISDNDHYVVHITDNDVNTLTLPKNRALVLNEDSYGQYELEPQPEPQPDSRKMSKRT